jgi:hypothetical protein
MKNYLPESTILGILKLIEVYEFYDQPCLFSCQNLSGQVYLALWIDSSETEDIWLYAPVSSERFNHIKNGEVDLKTVFSHSEDAFVFEVTVPFGDQQSTMVKALACRDLTEDQLPEAKQFIHSEILR